MPKTVVGMFDTFGEAQNAVQDLVSFGVRREEISLVARDEHGTVGEVNEVGAAGAAEGAGAGAVGGSVVGGALGLLIGTGLLVIPGIGPVLAAGPLAAAIGSTAAALGATALGAGLGAAAGGLMGSLLGVGIAEDDAHAYIEGVRRGGTLVSVATSDTEAEDVRQILVRNGAVDMEVRAAEWRTDGWETTGADARADLDATRARTAEEAPARGDYARGQRQEPAPAVEPDYARGVHDRELASGEADLSRSQAGELDPGVPHHGDFARGMRQEAEPLQPDYARGQRSYELYDTDFISHYQAMTGSGGQPYDYYKPGYQFGYDFANDRTYSHESWETAERDARMSWEQEARGSWEEFKQAIRYGWEKARGRV